MAAAELPRPGVEVIQEFRTQSPTVLRPTLVPFVTGAAKEIIEVVNADGTLNANAKLGTSYQQLPRVINQTAFPSPRGNIAEVDVEEATIQTYFNFGGSLVKLERDPGESFLTAFNYATRAAVRSNFFVTGSGLALNGLILVLAIDVTARLNTTKDVTVTFVGSGNLTPTQIVNQINTAVGDTVASAIAINGSDTRIQIASNKYGAGSSVTIRAGGSANTTLGFASPSSEYRVEGSGFRAQDQNNNTTLSPWVEWSPGVYLVDGVSTSLPSYDDTVPSSGAGFGFIDSTATFTPSLIKSGTTFASSGLDLKVGDQFTADGAAPNGALIMKVESTRFKLGTINTKLSTFDTNGNVVAAVYDASNVNTLFAATPFAPRYAWFMAKNLTGNLAATAAVLTGTTEGTAATAATVTSPAVPAGSSPYALAGLTLKFDVTINGVLQDTQTFTFTGGPFAALSDIVTAVGTHVTGIFAHTDTGGTKIAFSTNLTGATQALVLRSDSTALVALGFLAATEYDATGTDVEFDAVGAQLLGGNQTFSFTGTNGQTLVVKISADGGATYPTTRTYTFTTGTLTFANIGALVTELNAGTHWDGATSPSPAQFTFSAVGNKLLIKGAATGHLAGLKVDSTSTAIGGAANATLQFTSNQSDTGEDAGLGELFKFQLNGRPHTYMITIAGNSLVDLVANINENVGFPVASIGGTNSDQLVLTSTLKGYASSVTVIDDSGSQQANRSLGFGSGNRSATGTGRPNPDFSIDTSGNVVLGAEILRSQLTGIPFDPGVTDIYIQYHGLRKDVSPSAKDPGILRISDVTTLGTVLNPLTPDNPLGLGFFFMLLNAPGLECAGMGVDETNAAAPFGTLEAFTRVASALESQEVYAIAPLTHDVTVHQMFNTHVQFMSGAEQKGERIVFVNAVEPTRAVDDVVASGLSAGSTATSDQLVVDVNPSPGLVSRGLDPLSLTYDDQVFIKLTVAGQSRTYLVSEVNGTLVIVTTTFATGQNADGFFSTTPLTETVVDADWTLAVRGDLLLIPGSTLPDKDKIAETVAAQSSGYKQRRLYNVFPDTFTATLAGTDQSIPGFYACAAIAGMVARFPPQQGFTNMPMTGFTGVKGSQDTFSVKQLNVMAGGGTYIIVQDAQGAPLASRHQLSTDITSIETRELSITKVVDYVAKFMRTALRNFIGTFNINQPLLDTLSTVIQGMLGFLVENGIILGGELNNLIQSKDEPDTVLIDVTLDVPFPCNYIRLTLAI